MQPASTRAIETQTPEEAPVASGAATARDRTSRMESSSCPVCSPLAEKNVYTFWRGRVALYAILKSLGVGPGDSVLVPGYTCFAVPAAVIFTGAQPVYADIAGDSYNVSLQTIQAAWSENAGAKKIKAILLQHTFGVPLEMSPILAWARKEGIATIEDCAHAWGSRYHDDHGEWHEVGRASDAAFYSSQWTKPVSTGLGGWARANSAQLDRRLRRFHDEQCVAPSRREVVVLASQVAARGLFSASWTHWTIRSIYRWFYKRGLLIGTSTPEELQGKMPPEYAKQMSGYQRRLLEKRLGDSSVQAHRRRLKNIYDEALSAAGLPVYRIPDHADAVLLRYPVRVADKKKVLAEAERIWIELGDWYTHPIDRPEGLPTERFGYSAGMCPEGERAAAETVNLPMHAGVTEKTARRAVEFLKKVARA